VPSESSLIRIDHCIGAPILIRFRFESDCLSLCAYVRVCVCVCVCVSVSESVKETAKHQALGTIYKENQLCIMRTIQQNTGITHTRMSNIMNSTCNYSNEHVQGI